MAIYHNKTSFLSNITCTTLLIFCFPSAVLHADNFYDSNNSSSKSKQLSLEVYPQWYSHEDFSVQGNIGIEKEFENNSWIQYYMKPSGTYALDNNWALHGGLGGYYKDYQDDENRWEVRPYVGVSHYYPWTENLVLSSYVRAEERYYAYNGDKNSTNTTRLRFRLRSAYTFDADSFISYWDKFTLGAEVFKSEENDESSDNPDDKDDIETRVTLGLERRLSQERKLRLELAWKYKSEPYQLSGSSVNTIYFKVKYYPVWGEKVRNKLFDREIDE